METKKEIFKLLIKEFHELKPPQIIKRDHPLCDYCAALVHRSPAIFAQFPSSRSSLIAIVGPRRCGKTYLMFQLIEHLCSRSFGPVPRYRIFYINLEDDRLLPLTASDLALLPDAYFELYPDNRDKEMFIFIDGIHLAEGWPLFLPRLLEHGNRHVFITNSPSKVWTWFLPSSLSCRALQFAISPLTFKEFLVFKGLDLPPDYAYSNIRFKIKNLLQEYITFGGYPEVVLTDSFLKLQVIRNYYDIFIYKELVEEFSIRNLALLKEVLKYTITHSGSVFSVNSYFLSVQPKMHVSRETILDYISHFEEKGLIGLIPIFSDSPKIRQVNPKKIFLYDNGIHNAVTFPIPYYEERLVKNLVFQKLRRSGSELFYWQKRGGVDFVAKDNGKLHGINVSYGRELGPTESNSLLEFRSSLGRRDADMTIITKDTEKMEKGILFSPLWKWLLA